MSLNNAEDYLRETPAVSGRRNGADSNFKASVTKVTRREVKMLNDRYFSIWLQGFLDFAMGKLWKERFIDDDGRPPPGLEPTAHDEVLVRDGLFNSDRQPRTHSRDNVVKIENVTNVNLTPQKNREDMTSEEKADYDHYSPSHDSSSSSSSGAQEQDPGNPLPTIQESVNLAH
jgi:hypothetical protein